ncbi:hypothetical protein TRFO_06440 [Tritrichomonas foetus]|uniref:LisH domain-containing protein n=1 Tax=Tritrichomonas foetus TaxID=1144522 RepID=A0A1J4JYT0_9EUKA|nr:hypothetical protein TRFO_06440 [Tritrichomonas foetus]|eukprot:OHT04131.1 hypothetical protein TRFO_06440 [Tritrichomonas foetus]
MNQQETTNTIIDKFNNTGIFCHLKALFFHLLTKEIIHSDIYSLKLTLKTYVKPIDLIAVKIVLQYLEYHHFDYSNEAFKSEISELYSDNFSMPDASKILMINESSNYLRQLLLSYQERCQQIEQENSIFLEESKNSQELKLSSSNISNSFSHSSMNMSLNQSQLSSSLITIHFNSEGLFSNSDSTQSRKRKRTNESTRKSNKDKNNEGNLNESDDFSCSYNHSDSFDDSSVRRRTLKGVKIPQSASSDNIHNEAHQNQLKVKKD